MKFPVCLACLHVHKKDELVFHCGECGSEAIINVLCPEIAVLCPRDKETLQNYVLHSLEMQLEDTIARLKGEE